MITVYGYVPGFGVPDISPFVNKVVNYLTFVGLDFEWKPQDLATLDEDSPTGKLPYIVDSDGTKVADSTAIINYLKDKYGDKLDADLSAAEAANNLAWTRLVEENLYWSGIIEPRWRLDEGWEVYMGIIVNGEVNDDIRTALAPFRQRILDGFNGQGMGRRSSEAVQVVFRLDVDALADYLGDKTYFTGDALRTVDATVYSTLKHIANQPHPWPGTGYVQTKPNLVAYLERLETQFGI
ncbi:glutathione S-transferase C-terminal domain-containing protein [Nocardioides sp. WS12]|uniref:iIsoprene-epoxide--glutathione S-transferase n=1 Tax=Nocardioides sp. WS12 TaxID=2486272 RepID=UPI0015FD8FD3|nr:glutathione S-transferase C-terminal domain-containing protein [Nocardioides sp. WS12]